MENRVCPSDVGEFLAFPLLWDPCTEKLDPEDFCREAAYVMSAPAQWIWTKGRTLSTTVLYLILI